jgi:NAD(P)-dependent dehydrogenase (short-subunit alcohol dehydrogenase family)
MTVHKVAIVTGASRGIGAGLAAGYRARDVDTEGYSPLH